MNKIFLDVGANDSCSARIWRKLYDKKCEYQIYSFEPEPKFKNNFDNIEKCIFLPYAVGVEDGTIEFYRDEYDSRKAGGTLMRNKTSGKINYDKPINVIYIDFSRWIQDSFNKDDEIILKMDAEGMEYDIIPKMFKDGTFEWINKLMIEWHHYKFTNITLDKHERILKLVENIPQEGWPGVENAVKILGKNYLK